MKHLVFKTIYGNTNEWEKAFYMTQQNLNNRIVARHKSRPFNILFERKSNSLVDHWEVIEAKVIPQKVRVKAEEMKTIVFPAIEARTREEAKKQCEKKNNEP
jgi:hypothetical protein